jgi:hypothetical protein
MFGREHRYSRLDCDGSSFKSAAGCALPASSLKHFKKENGASHRTRAATFSRRI